jgi:hypothetical protein
MLTAKFETRKPPGAEGAPKLLFFLGLLSPKPAGIMFRIHQSQSIWNKTNDQSPLPIPLPATRGEGAEMPKRLYHLGATRFLSFLQGRGTRRLADIFS